ncbi:hypothetical protein BDA96_06G198000 [Sorghum bicolor]|uniref:Uncharacterized protein n=2 Tax=Sorghum bicolor TaxID=4558 RepID=A0A921UD14_SORBI|nr:hypothetical protein BDA96_06G198000 [Sorghum bicolor]OQU82150.1 hypothetical protein SORBI_3006G181150 [Sorghum bicolor]
MQMHKHSRSSSSSRSEEKAKNRKRAGQKGTVAEARRGRRARTRAYLDGGARCSPPASPCQGHTSSSSTTPRAKAGTESRRPGTSRQPDRGHFCVRPLVCLPTDREVEEELGPRLTAAAWGWGRGSRAKRCRAPGSYCYWWLAGWAKLAMAGWRC